MLFWAVLLFTTNLIDGISTWIALRSGYAQEANPIMRDLYNTSPLLFLVIKIALCTLAIVLVFGLRKAAPKGSLYVLIGSNLLYMMLMGVHITMWVNLLGGK